MKVTIYNVKSCCCLGRSLDHNIEVVDVLEVWVCPQYLLELPAAGAFFRAVSVVLLEVLLVGDQPGTVDAFVINLPLRLLVELLHQ